MNCESCFQVHVRYLEFLFAWLILHRSTHCSGVCVWSTITIFFFFSAARTCYFNNDDHFLIILSRLFDGRMMAVEKCNTICNPILNSAGISETDILITWVLHGYAYANRSRLWARRQSHESIWIQHSLSHTKIDSHYYDTPCLTPLVSSAKL